MAAKTNKTPITKPELVRRIAELRSLTQSEVFNAITIVTEGIKAVLKDKAVDWVRLNELVDFQIVERAARSGRNPKTGEKINIPATKTIKAKVSNAWSRTVRDGK